MTKKKEPGQDTVNDNPEDKPGEPEPEPGEDHPRFKEIYGRMKSAERDKDDIQKDLDALRSHSRQMMSRVEDIEKSKVDRPEIPMPNPQENPAAWEAWYKSDRQKTTENFQKIFQKGVSEAVISAIKFNKPDYEAMAGVAEEEIAKGNESLKNEIWGSESPYRAAYEYGVKKRAPNNNNSPSNDDSPAPMPPKGVEGGGDHAPAPTKTDKLSEDESRVVRQMWFPGEKNIPVDKWSEATKKYRAHQTAMGLR